MKNKILLFCGIIIFCSPTMNAQRENVLYKITSDSILKAFPKDSSFYRDLQFNMQELTFIGEFQTAIEKVDFYNKAQPINKQVIDNLRKTHNLNSYKPYSAVNYILNRADKERIIIINENHTQTLHRVFTTSLLQGLYDKGFRYLALEALSEDSLLNIRKYADIQSGYYTRNPQFGNMVREALKIGYKVRAYDNEVNAGKDREESEALNIKKILDKDSAAKILVHCGFGHGTEDNSFSQKLMGGWVQEYTKINPFTINQVSWTEHSKNEYEDHYFIALQAKSPSVFINDKNELLKGSGFSGYDIDIYHPRSKYINGRPDWLILNGTRAYFFIPKEKLNLINYPMLALAYCANEDSSIAIPADIMELKSSADKKALVLKPGDYKIILRNNKGEEQTFNTEIKAIK